MADNIFRKSPTEVILDQEASPSSRSLPSYSGPDLPPDVFRAAIDAAAIRYEVPANVLMALSEGAEGGSPPMLRINDAARGLRAAVAGGARIEDVVPAPVLQRAVAIGSTIYASRPEQKQEEPQAKAEPAQPESGFWGTLGDIGRSLKIGTDVLAQDVRGLASRVLPQSAIDAIDSVDTYLTGKPSEQLLKDDIKAQAEAMTPRMQEAAGKKWWDSDKGTLGPAWTDWRSYATGVAQSLPESMVTMVPAVGLARGVYAARVAAGAAPEAAAKLAARVATASGAITEGLFGGEQSSRDVKDAVTEIPAEVLAKSDAFQALKAQGMSDEQARAALAGDLSTRAFVTGGVATGIFGGMGDRVIAKILTEQVGPGLMKRLLRNAGEAVVGEGLLEELPQSALQQLAQNEAAQKADPRVSLSDDVANQALGGLAIGSAQGAGMGGVASALSARRGSEAAQQPDPQTAPVEVAVDPIQADSSDVKVKVEPPAGPLSRALASAPVAEAPAQDAASDVPERRVEIAGKDMEPLAGVVELQNEAGIVLRDDAGNRYEIPADEFTSGNLTISDLASTDTASEPPSTEPPSASDLTAANEPPTLMPEVTNAGGDQSPPPADAGEQKVYPSKGAAKQAMRRRGEDPEGFDYQPAEGGVTVTAKAAESADYASMDEAQLKGRLDYLTSQARSNGGWNKRLTAERSKIEAAMSARNEAPTNADSDVGGRRGNAVAPVEDDRRAGVDGISANAGDGAVATDVAAPDVREGVPPANGAADQQPALSATPDASAHEAATSPLNDRPEPTQAQKEAGNYKVGRLNLGGLDISVENPEGSQRKGVDRDGKPWSVTMKSHYGYIRGTVGRDKDHVDVFVRPGTAELTDASPVFVVDQKDAQSGAFDEHKVMLGFESLKQAQKAYQANYAKGWKGLAAITPMTMSKFREWVKDPAKTKEPAHRHYPWPMQKEETKGGPRANEHPGLVIKSPQTGKETTNQPAGTVPPKAPDVSQEPKVTRLKDDFGNYIVPTGSKLYTTSGRPMAPSPKADVSTPRKRNRSLHLQREWLIDEARKEVATSDNGLLKRMVSSMSADNLSRSDMDTLNEILFGADEPTAANFAEPRIAASPAKEKTAKDEPPKKEAQKPRSIAASDTAVTDIAKLRDTNSYVVDSLESAIPGWPVGSGGRAHLEAKLALAKRLAALTDDQWVKIQPYGLEPGHTRYPEDDMALLDRVLGPEVATSHSTKPEAATPKPTAYGAANTFVSADRAAELRKRLKAKLRNQLNSGIDPEVLAIGAELAAFHIEAGARRFADFAQAIARDLDTTVEKVRPYLRAWYNGARDMMEDAGQDIAGTDTPETVRAELAKLSAKEAGNEPGQLDQSGAGALEGVPAGGVQGAAESRDAEDRPDRSGRKDASGNERVGSGRDDDAGGVGNDTRAVSVPARGEPEGRARGKRGRTAVQHDDAGKQRGDAGGGRGEQSVTPTSGQTAAERGSDFAHTSSDTVGRGGSKTKFRRNVEAIRLLKTLEIEGRPATREEQSILARYVGWGGLPQAFGRSDGGITKGWEKEVSELRDLLTPEEYRAAEASTRNAHYTSSEIVRAMWGAMRHIGFAGGRVLEPSVGVGNFFGLMPPDLRNRSALHGVELDAITGGIAKHLYPAAKIAAPMGFQDYVIPDGHFDAVIGNPPFGAEKLYDGRRKDLSGFSIHNYFFAKAVDGLRPGGVLAMVVTNRMMDAAGDKARRYIADRTRLLGAIRLPNNAFLANAGTEVTTDIIFLRKLAEGEAPGGEAWMEVKDHVDKSGKVVPLNEYFVRHPEMMLGEFGAFGSMYRPDDPALIAREDQDTDELLEEAINRLPADVMSPVERSAEPEPAAPAARVEHVRVGSMFLDGDAVKIREEDSLGEARGSAVEFPNDKARERVVGLIGVRDHFADLRRLQLDPKADDARVEAARARLNDSYDAFVSAHGPINLDANKRLFRDDPSWPQLAALEDNFDRGVSATVAKSTGEQVRKPSARKAAVFTKRTQRPYAPPSTASSAKDALVTSLSERGRVDLGLMQQLYGKPADAIVRELDDLIYQDPQRGWVTRDEYLSGNVKRKLAEARQAANTDAAYRRNVDALEAVQPVDVPAIDIQVKPGAHWVPREVMASFAEHISGDGKPSVVYNPVSAKWIVKVRSGSEADAKWATGRASLSEILEAAANQKTITVRDRVDENTTRVNEAETQLANDKVRAIAEEWRRWIWADDARRESLGRLYNDMFNTDVLRAFDGSHLTFPGKVGNDIVTFRPHQANAIWRAVQSETTLLDHVVGAGKTFTMVSAAMEMRRMGLARKPMFAVPNHLVSQWAADFIKLYPGAQVLATTKRDFEASNRKRLFARIATGDWDAVIVAHSSFGKVEVEPSEQAAFIEEQISDLQTSQELMRQAEGKEGRNVKQIQNQIALRREKIKKLLDAKGKDDSLYWGELGVDALFVDEAHEFKNLEFSTSMQRVAGLGNASGSQKASDLFLKARQVLKATGGRNIVFATGTPISNTMAEMFTMQRYLDYPTLSAQGLSHFDAWARQFGEVVTDWELSPSGQYKLNSRFAKFVNMPELLQRYRSFADVVDRDDINRMLAALGKRLPVPKIKGDKPENVVVGRSTQQAAYIGEPVKDPDGNDTDIYPKGSLVWRAENLPKRPEKGADNMLKIMSDARKAALDMRMIYPDAGDDAGSKVNVAARRILDLYRKWNADKGAQLVFIDLSTPKGARADEAARVRDLLARADEGDAAAAEELDKLSPDEIDALNTAFSVYDDLKSKLVALGIPENEIAFIHDAKTDLQKSDLFGKVRSGRIRVLLGSTAKMGAGTNVQDRLVGLHHLDAPWRPSDLEQREGRIIRQGNLLYDRDPDGFEVEILRYATKQTLDSRMWQTIEGKARFIEQVRKGASGQREIEDIGGEAANAAEMKAASSGNPLVLEEMTLRQRIKRLETERYGHESEQFRLRDTIRSKERSAAWADKRAAEMRADATLEIPSEFTITIDGQTYDKRKEAGAAILKAAALLDATYGSDADLGAYGGFKLTLDRIGKETFTISLSGTGEYQTSQFTLATDPQGLALRVSNAVRDLAGQAEALEERAARDRAAVPKLEEQIREWPKAAELEAEKARHLAVLEKLKPKKRPEASPDQAAKNSESSTPAGAEAFSSSADAQAHLRNGAYGIAVSAMLDAGRLVIHSSQTDLPKGLQGEGKTIQGVTDTTGVVHLVAGNLTPSTLQPALFHEVFHALGEESPAWGNLIRRLDAIYKAQAAKAPDARAPFWRDAMRRVEAANVAPQHRGEELGAYAIEHREQAPAGILIVIDNLVGRVKDWLLRKTGMQVGGVTPGQLRAFTAAALRGAPKSRGQAKAKSFSLKDFGPNDFIPAPDGDLDFGHIGIDVAKAIHREAAPIRVKAGNEDFGLRHIEMKGDEITKTYKDAREFIADIAKNYDAIYQAAGRRLFLTKTLPRKHLTLVVEINATPDGSAYTVVTGGVRRDTFFKKRAPLWGGAPSNQAVSSPPYAISGQSGEENIASEDDDAKGPRFSLTDTTGKTQDRWLSDKLSDTLTAAMPKLLATVPLRPMLEELGKGMPAATAYLRTKQAMDALRNEWHAKAATVSDAWLKYRSHNRAENARLMEVMHESTLTQNDPTGPFQPKFTAHDATVTRYGDPESEDYRAAQRRAAEDKERRAAYKDIKAKYDALSPEAQAMYVTVRDTYSQMADDFEKVILSNMEKALKIAVRRAEREHRAEMQRISDEGLTGNARENAIKAADTRLKTARTRTAWNARWRLSKMRQQFESNRLTGPYFPLSRFGNFFVTVRDETGKVVSFSRFESPAKQRAFAAEMGRDKKLSLEVGALSDTASIRRQVDPNFVADVEEIMEGAAVPDALKDQVWQRYLETLPDYSVRKNRIHRLGRAGFQADALRAFASNLFHGSHQLARAKYGMDLAEHIRDAREQAKDAANPVRAGLLVNEMERRDAYIMNPEGSALATALTGAAFVYFLAASPAAALANLSQTVIMGVPLLGAYHGGTRGIARASTELTKAMRDFAAGKGAAERSTRLTGYERSAMQEAYASGVIDKSQAHDLAGVGETGVEYSSRRQKVMAAISIAFHQTERFNREVTFLAAYRLAREKGEAHEAAVNTASSLTWKTHFDYQNTSRPRIMYGDTAKVALTFRNFNVNMLFRLFRDTHQALHGASDADRREARTQLLGITAMMVANAGIRGTWMFGIAMMLAGLFFGLSGHGDDDPEEELQKAAVSLLGPTLAGIALNGLPGHALGISLSERIGMPDLWFRSPDRQLEGEDAYHFWADQMLGASFGVVQNLFRGYKMIEEGNIYRGVETMAPKAIRDLMKSYRYATDGAQTMKGDTISEEVPTSGILKQAIGFTPAQIAERYQINTWKKNRDEEISSQRKKLLNEYGRSTRNGDDAGTNEVLKTIEDFNNKYQDDPITGRTLVQSVKARQRASERNEGGISISPKLNEFIRSRSAPPIYE